MSIGPTHPAQLQRGFTLLEVMIALAVVATVLVALLGLGTRSIGTHTRLQKMTQATLLAQQKLADLELTQQGTGEGFSNSKGDFGEQFSEFTWRTVFTGTPVSGVKQVEVIVAWGEENQNEAVQIASFLFE